MNASAHATADTIIAVSSPPGRSPRGLIRLSGDASHAIIGRLIDEPVGGVPASTQSKVHLADPAVPALLTRFDAPCSYTGQDAAELQVPGHPALLDRLLHAGIDAGARLAEPGEFTFRAFLAGKLDLTQAEGIAATISATSDTQLRAARHLLDGELGGFARSLVDDLGTRLALVEAGIDFTDQEDVVPIGPAELDGHLADAEARLDELLANSRPWSEVEALPWVVLVGAPSAGKSTLFNALLGRERAVIDPQPGTTRDVLCEPMKTTGPGGEVREWMLVDVAGLDEAAAALPSPLEAEAQAVARAAIERADLSLRVIDPTRRDESTVAETRGASSLIVYSQSDRLPDGTAEINAPDAVFVSGMTGEGVERLRGVIGDRLGRQAVSVSAEMLALQPRHEQALRAALGEVVSARGGLAGQLGTHAIDGVELIAGHIRQALDDLAALGGQLSPDDVIGRVFATFCVGK